MAGPMTPSSGGLAEFVAVAGGGYGFFFTLFL